MSAAALLPWLLVLVPALAGGLAFAVRTARARRALWLGGAVAHAALAAAAWALPPASGTWLALDPLGRLFTTIGSAVFLAVAWHGRRGLRLPPGEARAEAVLAGGMLFFLAASTLVALARNFGLLWVALEATTLATAPLIGLHRGPRPLEATWKYLLLCSVGIALALLGTFFLAVAASPAPGVAFPLTVDGLTADATLLNVRWLKMAFLFLLAGYGVKMGLAPMHAWLPDAHSEAPPAVSALLSGAVLNGAFVVLARAYGVVAAAGLAPFASGVLVIFGLLSMAVAAVFVLGQRDYKRLLAYSSIEHMGILVLGLGAGGVGLVGAMLHAVGHSGAKAMLFLVSGNLYAAFGTKRIADVRGALRVAPASGALWLAGFLALTGTPPASLFISKFTILKALFDGGRYATAGLFLALLAVIFAGIGARVLRMVQGPAPPDRARVRETMGMILPPLLLGVAVLLLGLHQPAGLRHTFEAIAVSLRARP